MKHAKLFALATTAIASGMAFAPAAFAQSTGTETVQELVVTSHKTQSVDGLVTEQEGPKTREIISQQYISTQTAGQNPIADLNLIPGVSYTQDDPYGMSGSAGHISIRGIHSSLIAELVDGVPLNDAGNYAIYPGELIDSEVISNVNVITGSTDVDSPTSSSLGGLININTLQPSKNAGGFLQASAGSFFYKRLSGLFQSGEVGPIGTTAWLEGSYQEYNKFTDSNGTDNGTDRKWQLNAKVYQDLHHDGDFIAIAGFYDRQIADFYDGVNFASYGVPATSSNYHPPVGKGTFGGILATPWNSDYSDVFQAPSSTSSNASFQGVEENPTFTGNMRAESRFTLLPNLRLTVDPSYQWVLANGEGSSNIKESDPRLIGSGLKTSLSNFPTCYSAAGVVTGLDLDGAVSPTGAPTCTDTVRLLSPSNTQTTRWTLNTSLIWDFLPGQLVQLAYAYDHGHVRQTGEYGLLSPTGYPYSLFGGLSGYGTPIIAADGTTFQKRNRLTDAELDQGSIEYIGHFFDNRLRLDLGVRVPYFKRDLNQYCYTQPPSNVYCTANTSIALSQGYVVAPFTLHTSYNKALPNVGFTYNFDKHNSVFADYTTSLNAPVNDDLYSIATVATSKTPTLVNTIGADNVQPETTTTYEVGYRFQSGKIKSTFDIYDVDDQNHIVTSFNQLTNDSVDQNVGSIRFYGAEALFGAEVLPHLSTVLSFSYNHSRTEDNLPYSATVIEPTAGKFFYDSPEFLAGGLVTYDWRDYSFGLQGKYTSRRFVTYVNDLSVPSYITFDAYFRWRLPMINNGSYFQFNALNLFDEKYIGSINPAATNNGSLPYYTYSYAYQGAPRTLQATIRVAF